MIVFFGVMFHPMYTIVNAIILGHEDDHTLLAGLGLGSLTLGICSLSLHWNFGTGSGVAIGQAFGQEEFRMCAVYANR